MTSREIKHKLEEFSELWNFGRDWVVGPDIKAYRASAIHFLETPIRPSKEGRKVVPYLISPLRIEEITDTFCGEAIVSEETRDLDLQRALVVSLTMRGDLVKYIFLVESDADMPEKTCSIIIVKPPVGKKNFADYTRQIHAKYQAKAA